MISAFGEKPKITKILFLCTSVPPLKTGVRVEGNGICYCCKGFITSQESIRIPESIWEPLLSGREAGTWCHPSPLLALDLAFPTLRSADSVDFLSGSKCAQHCPIFKIRYKQGTQLHPPHPLSFPSC